MGESEGWRLLAEIVAIQAWTGEGETDTQLGIYFGKEYDSTSPANNTLGACTDARSTTRIWQREILCFYQQSMVSSNSFQRPHPETCCSLPGTMGKFYCSDSSSWNVKWEKGILKTPKKKKKKITWKVIKAGKNGVNPERLSTAHQKVVHML